MAARHPRFGVGAGAEPTTPEATKARGSTIDLALTGARVRFASAGVAVKVAVVAAALFVLLLLVAPSLLLFDDVVLRERGLTTRMRKRFVASRQDGAVDEVGGDGTEAYGASYDDLEETVLDGEQSRDALRYATQGANDDDVDEEGSAAMARLFSAGVDSMKKTRVKASKTKARLRRKKARRKKKKLQASKQGRGDARRKKKKARAHTEAEVSKLHRMQKEHKAQHKTVVDAVHALIEEKGLSKALPQHAEDAAREESAENTKALRAALDEAAVGHVIVDAASAARDPAVEGSAADGGAVDGAPSREYTAQLRDLISGAGIRSKEEVQEMSVEVLREALHGWIMSGDSTYAGAAGLSDVMAKLAELDMERATIGDLTSWVLVIEGRAKYVRERLKTTVTLHLMRILLTISPYDSLPLLCVVLLSPNVRRTFGEGT